MSQTDESSATTSAATPTDLPRPPRPITSRARRRAWGDIHVRIWWLSALAVVLVIGWFTIGRVRDGLRDRDIIKNGIPVQTIIKTAGEKYIKGQSAMREGFTTVTLVGTMPDGTTREFTGELPPAPGYLVVGNPLEIRIARDDPNDWTGQVTPMPWTRQLAMSLMFLPVIIVLSIIALFVRRQVLRVWQLGVPAAGVVTEVRHSAYAPRSRVVRYSLVGAPDRRIYAMLSPPRVPVPAVGEEISLLMLPAQPKRSIWTRIYAE
ncbi:MAG: hypothetical protein QOF78_3497 [Phycisphaerales bacterium]|nr:hypothetical protein [Phycisphaerales bacterium]